MTSKQILCELYDYIEIACMYRLSVLLLLIDGEEIKGIATDTLVKSDKLEYLIIVDAASKIKIEIPMNKIIQMEALTKNAHFDKVVFQND